LANLKLVEATQEQKNDYNRFVAACPSGSFLQSWEWGQWQEALGREVIRYKILDDSGEQIASIQLIKMRLFGKKYYWYAPYGPVLAGGESSEFQVASFESLVQELRNRLIGSVFIRIEPKLGSQLTTNNSQLVKSANIQPGKTLLIDLQKSDEELLEEMHHKTRYNIKVAQKHGVEIKDEFEISIGHGLFVKEAVEIIAETARRQGFKDYGAGYYNKMIDFFVLYNKTSARAEGKNSGQSAEALAKADAVSNRGDLKLHIYKAIYQNIILASALLLDFSAKGGSQPKADQPLAGATRFGGGTRTFLFGGSTNDYKNVMAPFLMHWQAMQDAKAAGFAQYDFWGIETSSGETPGFVRFKLGFGGNQKQFPGAYDIVCDRLWYKIYSYARKINRLIKKASA